MRAIRGRLRASALMPMALVALMTVGGCNKSPIVETRVVNVNVPQSCAHYPTAMDLSQAYGVLRPGGDYDASQVTPPELYLGAGAAGTGQTLSFPANTMSLVVNVTDGGPGDAWTGVSLLSTSGSVDVLAWPMNGACDLMNDFGKRPGSAIGAIDSRHVLIAGGFEPSSAHLEVQATPVSYLVDLATGSVTRLDDVSRVFPTITPTLNGGAIIAGGFEPIRGVAPLATALLYEPGPNGSPGQIDTHDGITLREPRANHGAAMLTTGETVLVGGIIDNTVTIINGTSFTIPTITSSIEIVDPSQAQNATLPPDLVGLSTPRQNPSVFRLASGEILVAGGTQPAADPTAPPIQVDSVEWISATHAQCPLCATAQCAACAPPHNPQVIVATQVRDFAALGGGGAIAVMAPDPVDPNQACTASASSSGCPPGGKCAFQTQNGVTTGKCVVDQGFLNVVVIAADGSITAATPIPNLTPPVRLFSGVGGAPILWTGLEDSQPGTLEPLGQWMRYAPWSGAFVNIPEVLSGAADGNRPLAPDTPSLYTIGPTNPDQISATNMGHADEPTTSTDGGIALWLQDDDLVGTHLWGYRFGTSNAYLDVPTLLLVDGPDYLAPDRYPDTVYWDSTDGLLIMQPGATATVADATFASVDIDFATESDGYAAPYVVLHDVANGASCDPNDTTCRGEIQVGAVECLHLAGNAIHVERNGSSVSVSVDDGPLTPCQSGGTLSTLPSDARVTIGLRGSTPTSSGSPTTSAAQSLKIIRTGN